MRTLAKLWDDVADVMFHGDDFSLDTVPLSVEEAIEKTEMSAEERAMIENDLREQKEWEEYEAGNPFAEELKTHVPGLGFIVTNLGTGETAIFPDEEIAD